MAKVKFNLIFNGNPIRSLEELRENFSVEDALADYRDGRLARWLEARWFHGELAQVQAIRATDGAGILDALVRIFGVNIDAYNREDLSPEAAALVQGVLGLREQERREREAKERREQEEQARQEQEERDRRKREEWERRKQEEKEQHQREYGSWLANDLRLFLDSCGNKKLGSIRNIRSAIEAGVDVNAKNGDSITPLMKAAGHNTIEVVNALLEAGADVNAKDCSNLTPLHWASVANTADVVDVLLRAGADVNAKSRRGSTVLMGAAQSNTADVITVLLNAGADINAKDKDGLRAIDYAQGNEKLRGKEIIERLEPITYSEPVISKEPQVSKGFLSRLFGG